MTNRDEPQRLFESAQSPPALRRLLVRAHADALPPDQAARFVKEAISRAALAAPVVGWRAPRTRWGERLGRRSTKLMSLAAVVGVGAGALYVAGVDGRRASRPPIAADAPAVAAPVITPIEATTPGAGRTPPTEADPPLAPDPAAPRTPVARPRPHRSKGVAAAERRPAAEGLRPQVAPAFEAKPADAAPATDEAALLRSARQALATSPARTLALTQEHRRRYPRGILDQEREALAIDALIALGRDGEARARARTFELAYPGSPHRARIERALGAAARPDTGP